MQALEELSILPSFSSHSETDLALKGPYGDGHFTATLGAFEVHCSHHSQPDNDDDNIAYGGCAVLSFLDLYWSPFLGCVVSPQAQSILLHKELKHYVLGYESNEMQNHNPQLLIKHIEDAFDINPATNLSILYEGCRSKVLQHPIPGLHLPDKRYKCPDCGLWYSNYQHHVKLELGCKQSNTVSKRFSVPLYPPSIGVAKQSPGTHYRLELSIPDHRKLAPVVKVNKRLRRRSEVFEEPLLLPAPGTQEEIKNIPLIEGWLKPNFSNLKGRLAPKLQRNGNNFQFSLGSRLFRCLHSDHPPGSDYEIYTGCAVLSYYQLYFSPILGAIVSPSEGTILCRTTLQRTIQSRVHASGIEGQTLLDHLIRSFELLTETEDIFDKIHRNVRLKRPILGLEKPRLTYQCQLCGSSFSENQIPFKNHQSSCHPIGSKITPIRTYTIRLWNVKAKYRYRATMDKSWIDSHELSSTPDPARLQSLSYSDENAIHLKDSRFQKHVKSWNGDLSTIIQLFKIRSAEGLWTHDGIAWKIERCLGQIHRLTGIYLSDTERRMDDLPFLRRAITGLYPQCVLFLGLRIHSLMTTPVQVKQIPSSYQRCANIIPQLPCQDLPNRPQIFRPTSRESWTTQKISRRCDPVQKHLQETRQFQASPLFKTTCDPSNILPKSA